MRVLLVVLDGLADRQWPELGGKTPLEAAATPNLDRLAWKGSNGLLYPLDRGTAAGSDSAHFVLFGYSLAEFPGRAVFEALGHGFALGNDEVVLQANLVSGLEKDGALWIKKRAFPLSDSEGASLIGAIPSESVDGVSFDLRHTTGRQAVLYLRGLAGPDVTDSDPFSDEAFAMTVQPLSESADPMLAEKTANALNVYLRRAFTRLEEHPINMLRRTSELLPANFLVTKWAGQRRPVKDFSGRFGFKAASVSNGVLYHGLCDYLGIDFIETPGKSDPAEDLANRFEAAQKAFSDGYDFVHVHSKAPDKAAHLKNPTLKKEVIEKLDEAFAALLDGLLSSSENVIVVTADHATPSGTDLIHSGEGTPILVCGETVWKDEVDRYSELACARGALGAVDGKDLMSLLLNYTNRSVYFGARLRPDVPLYRPADIKPFKLSD